VAWRPTSPGLPGVAAAGVDAVGCYSLCIQVEAAVTEDGAAVAAAVVAVFAAAGILLVALKNERSQLAECQTHSGRAL